MNIHGKAAAQDTFDAIVVGSGISGAWAAKELTERGLKTLLLERGREIYHIKDYHSAIKDPWDFQHRLLMPNTLRERNPIQSRCYAFDESTSEFFIDDQENPYTQVKPYYWIRGNQTGGRSIMWGRQCYRWSDLDFEANLVDGVAVDWPIRYRDIEPWYDYVEAFVGISGNSEGLRQLPDSRFLPPMEMNCLEKYLVEVIRQKFPERLMTIGRVANLTVQHLGRGPCQYRNLCARGCPFAGYFTSLSSTLPAAQATGNLTFRPFAAVTEVIYDEKNSRASGVRIIDAQTRTQTEYFARVIFLNASTLGTAQILLNSTSSRFPQGLGNGSGQVGRNLMDHHYQVGATGDYEGLTDRYYSGRRPNGIYIPRFRNIDEKTRRRDYLRGFGFQGSAKRMDWRRGEITVGIGAQFKEQMTLPGVWNMWLGGWGECLPYQDNYVFLNRKKVDNLGLPTLSIDCSFRENELSMRKDMKSCAMEMLELAGMKDIRPFDYNTPPGLCNHEMGTARMGKDPKTSVLNSFNQMHEVKNVFITDGACMTSSGCQNPSLTYMALTARACDYAFNELKKGNL